MSHESQTSGPAEVLDILQEACERNVPVELHYRNRQDEFTLARTRLLAMDEQQLYLDEPQAIGEATVHMPGQILDVYLSLYGTLYTCRVQVISSNCIVALNEQKRVTGMSVTRPAIVKPGQRRAYYRVSLAALDPVKVRMHRTGDIDPNLCPVDATRIQGHLVDLSLGGGSVRIDGMSYTSFGFGKEWFLNFTIPDWIDDARLLTTVRHVRSIVDGTAVRLGLQFSVWPDEHQYRLSLQALQKFLAAMQRRQLRRSA
jgi:c-di-GMP-binding flagellar brake protein YcgR